MHAELTELVLNHACVTIRVCLHLPLTTLHGINAMSVTLQSVARTYSRVDVMRTHLAHLHHTATARHASICYIVSIARLFMCHLRAYCNRLLIVYITYSAKNVFF